VFVNTSAAWACRQMAIQPWTCCSACSEAAAAHLEAVQYQVFVLQNAPRPLVTDCRWPAAADPLR
jgi:hypothetical protein